MVAGLFSRNEVDFGRSFESHIAALNGSHVLILVAVNLVREGENS